MTVWSLTASAAGLATPAGQLVKTRLAITTAAQGIATPAAWPYMLATSGDLDGSIPYFDAPTGWPLPTLAEP